MKVMHRSTIAIGIMCLICIFAATPNFAQRYMENLDRGVVAVKVTSGVFLSWRVLGTEWSGVSYNVYRGTTKLNSSPITGATNYSDASGTTSSTYSVAAVVNGVEQALSPAVSVWANNYLTVSLQRPAGGTTPDGVSYTYSPNDCSVGDLNGDGKYEIVVKWDPSNSKDNSQSGYTGKVFLDAYTLTGTRMWRIDLGWNIRAGAHYTQFMVYDLDGDGKAEVACKTADGTKDGVGTVIGSSTADYRNSSGYILSGPEFLTVFNGQTGAALATTNYIPPRGTVSSWGDSYGNRVDRFLACVAYLDGQRPSLVMCRGYYTRSVLAAWNWRNGQLTNIWTFDSNTSGNGGYAGQGNHNLSVGDVDQDGKDEIVYGACAINDNGAGLYTTGWNHGDAMALGDLNPNRSGLEVWQCHEGGSGATFRDARTGAQIWKYSSSGDVGRSCAADLTASYAGAECWAAGTSLYTCTGGSAGSAPSSVNHVVWWDGDDLRELLNSNAISKYGGSTLLTASGCSSINGTKSNPNLQVDLLGDWREEVIWRTTDNLSLRIYTTTTSTSRRLYTLMHDPQYRVSIAWQNVAYNQPPQTGFFIGSGMATPPTPNIVLVGGGGGSNNPPSVSITSPANGATFAAPATVTINANASDSDGSVTKVEFYQGATKLGEDSSSPYSTTWSSVAAGTYSLTAVATDDDGAATSSSPVSITVTGGGGSTSITIQESTTGFCLVDGTIDNNNSGYTGTGFANTTNATAKGVNWRISTPSSGTYTLAWRHANGSAARTAKLIVGGSTLVSSINFPATGAWTTWATVSVDVTLGAGTLDIRLEANTSGGLSNIDYLMVTGNAPQAVSCSGKASQRLDQTVPESFALEQNHPNPFNPDTEIRYWLPESGMVILEVFDIMGREVVTLVNEAQSPGAYAVRWNAVDAFGLRVPSGMYYCTITATCAGRTYTSLIKMLLLK